MLTLYVGDQKCGKSTLLRKHVYASRADLRAFLIIDRDRRGTWDGPVFTSADQLRRSPTIPRFCVFQRTPGVQVAKLAVELGDCIVVDEEIHRLFSEVPYRTTEHPKGGHPLFDIVHEGRHLENAAGDSCFVAAWGATHRVANVPADARELVQRVYLGRVKSYTAAKTVHLEGWLKDANATSPLAVRRALEARQVGEFTIYP